jgi:hypothetical protein
MDEFSSGVDRAKQALSAAMQTVVGDSLISRLQPLLNASPLLCLLTNFAANDHRQCCLLRNLAQGS